MMTAMIKPSDSNFDSDISDTASHSKSHINPTSKQSKGNKYQPNIKSKILGLKNLHAKIFT